MLAWEAKCCLKEPGRPRGSWREVFGKNPTFIYRGQSPLGREGRVPGVWTPVGLCGNGGEAGGLLPFYSRGHRRAWWDSMEREAAEHIIAGQQVPGPHRATTPQPPAPTPGLLAPRRVQGRHFCVLTRPVRSGTCWRGRTRASSRQRGALAQGSEPLASGQPGVSPRSAVSTY